MLTSLTKFMRFCRSNGLQTGSQQLQEAVQIIPLVCEQKELFRVSLRAICCKTKSEYDRFPALFAAYWQQNPAPPSRNYGRKPLREQPFSATLVYTGAQTKQDQSKQEVLAKEVTGASDRERLKNTDFSMLQDIDEKPLLRMAEKLWQQMFCRLRRRKVRQKRGVLDVRKTLQKGIAGIGFPHRLYFKGQEKEKRHLVFLLDISGSMDKYSLYLLRFMSVLRNYFAHLEAFTFSTELTRITDLLDSTRSGTVAIHPQMLRQFSKELPTWSSGTKIAACLQSFLSKYARKYLPRHSVVIILSDGLETENSAQLGRAVKNIRKQCKKLIWLNPLKGMTGYRPIQRGMAAALPHIDTFASAHNLRSLLQLEKMLKEL